MSPNLTLKLPISTNLTHPKSTIPFKGKNLGIVMPDADLDVAAEQVLVMIHD